MAEVFKDFLEMSPAMWLTIGGVIAIALVFLLIAKSRKRWSVNMLTTAAACLAIAFVLSCIRLYKAPQGGSVTPGSMLPIFVFSYVFGVIPGLLTGLAYSLMQMLQDSWFLNPVQILLDYTLPFALLALGGVFRDAQFMPKNLRLGAGAVVATLLRVALHVLSGAVYFAEYAGDMNPWVYSLGYNFSSVGVDGAICLVIALLPPVVKFVESIKDRQPARVALKGN